MPRLSSYQEALDYARAHPEAIPQLIAAFPHLQELLNIQQAQQDYESGNIDANALLGAYGQNAAGGRVSMSPETEKWLDNQIARENTQQQQGYELAARDTSLLSAGSQLQQLGLSGSSVLQTGGAVAGVSGSVASNNKTSTASIRQQAKINDYNQKMGLAKSLIGAAGSMASSGIYGAAIGAVKHSAQAIAGAAAHSGLEALKSMRPEVINQMYKDEAWRYNNTHQDVFANINKL